MRVLGLDGRTHTWDLRGYADVSERECSSLHLRARLLLQKLFPTDLRCEEVPIPGTSLFADFVLPTRKLMVESQGKQHYEESGLFHRTTLDFWRGRQRDARKVEWCRINTWSLACLPYDESDDEWAARILGAAPETG